MNNKDDYDLFLEAIDNMPDDVFAAKFEGAPPKRQRRKESRPDSPFDRTIDLHGFTRADSLAILRRTLASSKGKRLRLLVITGKGNNSEGGRSVVREYVVKYLEKAGSLYISSFCFASPKNGGDGAIEILTK